MSIGRDGIAGLILLAISLVLLVQSFQLPSLPIVPVGPGFYPAIVLSFMAAASALLVLQDLMKRGAPAVAGARDAPRRNYRLVVIAFAIVGAYVALLPLLGFRIATVLFVGALQAALGRPRTARQWVVLAAIALGTAAVSYFVFERYLLVLLPRGAGRVSDARSALATASSTSLQWKYMLPLFAGTFVGVIGGSLPGVTITMTVIVVLPFTYGLDPLAGLAAMTGVYVGGSTGGLITCCLLGIPGSPASIATTFDGFPMARNGEPGRAIWLGVWASVWGGLLGALFLVFLTGPLAAIALEFGPWEYFSLFVLAMAMVAGLTEASLVKGLLSTAIGLLITVVGTDPIGSVPRFTFGSEFIGGGFPFLPVLIGIFAFAQIMTDIEKLQLTAQAKAVESSVGIKLRAVLAPEGELGDLPPAVPAAVGDDRRADHRHPAGDRRQRLERDGLRPGQEILQDAGDVRQGPPRGHHRLGSLQQRQRQRLADDHHGVRHSRRRRHRRDARRHDDPRHPVGPAVHLAESRPRLWHLCGLHPGASADAGDLLVLHAADDPRHQRAAGGAGAGRAGAVRARRLRAQQHHAERLRAADVRRRSATCWSSSAFRWRR